MVSRTLFSSVAIGVMNILGKRMKLNSECSKNKRGLTAELQVGVGACWWLESD